MPIMMLHWLNIPRRYLLPVNKHKILHTPDVLVRIGVFFYYSCCCPVHVLTCNRVPVCWRAGFLLSTPDSPTPLPPPLFTNHPLGIQLDKPDCQKPDINSPTDHWGYICTFVKVFRQFIARLPRTCPFPPPTLLQKYIFLANDMTRILY